MSNCGRTSVHDPHPFVTTRGSYPPVEHTEQCGGVAERPRTPPPPQTKKKK